MTTPHLDMIVTKANRMGLAEMVRAAPVGSTVTVTHPEKSNKQNAHYHALIDDIACTCIFRGRCWKPESWKRLLVEAYVNVLRTDAAACGAPDPFPGDVLLLDGLDGESIVQLGVQTRHFTRRQAADFLEFLFAFGCEEGVVWSRPSQRVIETIN